MTRVFIYGSLKKGFYNHQRCNMDKAQFIINTVIHNAKLFSLGSYPAVILDGEEADIVYGEIYDIPDDVFKPIQQMEIGAGYSQRTISINDENVEIFVFDQDSSGFKRVVDGNWTD